MICPVCGRSHRTRQAAKPCLVRALERRAIVNDAGAHALAAHVKAAFEALPN